jgi:hypothetical protein
MKIKCAQEELGSNTGINLPYSKYPHLSSKRFLLSYYDN